ncbi:Plectin, partial [Manis pentadactyla]
MDMTPTPLAIIFRSPPTPHEAVGSTIPGHLGASANTARAVIVWSPLDPYDAMRGTADRLRPTTNSASDPVDMSQPLPMAPTGLPQLQTWPMSSYPFNKIFPAI